MDCAPKALGLRFRSFSVALSPSPLPLPLPSFLDFFLSAEGPAEGLRCCFRVCFAISSLRRCAGGQQSQGKLAVLRTSDLSSFSSALLCMKPPCARVRMLSILVPTRSEQHDAGHSRHRTPPPPAATAACTRQCVSACGGIVIIVCVCLSALMGLNCLSVLK